MKTLPPSSYSISHPTFSEIEPVARAILEKLGGITGLQNKLACLLRECIDDAVDIPGMERFFLADLMTQEKANIGTRVEIALRDLTDFPKRTLDFYIADRDVDVKFTIGNNWMIPKEAIGHICILIAADESSLLGYFGLLKADPLYLTQGGNRDKKVSVSAVGFRNINWLVSNHPYPQNFWRSVPPAQRKTIFSARGGTARLAKLFELFQAIPIHRSVIADIARQKDNMKRIRKNGGARDVLEAKGISILGGAYDSTKIARLGLPFCDREHFISTSKA